MTSTTLMIDIEKYGKLLGLDLNKTYDKPYSSKYPKPNYPASKSTYKKDKPKFILNKKPSTTPNSKPA